MRATAAAGFAHRHTVAYRLERILELTGHDPRRADGLEQLNLGLKARAVRDALDRTAPAALNPPHWRGCRRPQPPALRRRRARHRHRHRRLRHLVRRAGGRRRPVGGAGLRDVAARVHRRFAVRSGQRDRRGRLAGDRGGERAAAGRPQRGVRPLARARCCAAAVARAGGRGAAGDRRDDRDGRAQPDDERAARGAFWLTGASVFVCWNLGTLARRARRRRPRRPGDVRARRDVPGRVPGAARAAAASARRAGRGARGRADRGGPAAAHAGRRAGARGRASACSPACACGSGA